jgi:plasmid stabilization system protein ParE
MNYKIQLTEEAKLDLRGIYEYIANFLLEPMIAKNVKNRILSGLKSLTKKPEKISGISGRTVEKQRASQDKHRKLQRLFSRCGKVRSNNPYFIRQQGCPYHFK